jgi:starch phosphorylase
MARLTPQFSGNRAVREYTELYYLPAATSYHQRAAGNGAIGKQNVDWRHTLDQQWGSLGFGDVRVEADAEHHRVEVEIRLNGLDPNAVRVELYADGINGGDPVRQEMQRARTLPDGSRGSIYHATLPTTRLASDYTPRVIPQRSGVSAPLECARILWQR